MDSAGRNSKTTDQIITAEHVSEASCKDISSYARGKRSGSRTSAIKVGEVIFDSKHIELPRLVFLRLPSRMDQSRPGKPPSNAILGDADDKHIPFLGLNGDGVNSLKYFMSGISVLY